MPKIVVVYHSGHGHTERAALAVARGAGKVPGAVVVVKKAVEVGKDFAEFADADAIIFGSPTYMGGYSAEFKRFIDDASGLWYQRAWKDKIGAGFTNSGGLSGDKLNTLQSLCTNAMQHGMIWVGQAEMVGGTTPADVNRLSSFTGAMTQSDQGSREEAPPPGDITTCELFGERVARITAQFVAGRVASSR